MIPYESKEPDRARRASAQGKRAPSSSGSAREQLRERVDPRRERWTIIPIALAVTAIGLGIEHPAVLEVVIGLAMVLAAGAALWLGARSRRNSAADRSPAQDREIASAPDEDDFSTLVLRDRRLGGPGRRW